MIDLKDFTEFFSEEIYDINRVDAKKRTALHIAVLGGDNGVIFGLIKAGINIDALDNDGYSAFILALKENNIIAAGILMDVGVNLNIGAGCYGSALNIAVLKSEPKLVLRLLNAGLNPNTVDFKGNTCLHSLLEVFDKQKHRNTLIGDLLIQFKVSHNAENNEKWTPAHLAAKEKQLCAIKWMNKKNSIFKNNQKEGFNFSKPGGAHGWSPLHLASHSGDYDTVELLISVGANPTVKNYDGKTPKDTSKGNLALYKYLSRLEKECTKHVKLSESEIKYESPQKNITLCRNDQAYKLIYESYRFKDREELEDLVEEIENPIVKSDAIYLVGLFKQKKSSKMLYKAKKCKEFVVKNEVMHAMNMIKDIDNPGSQSLANLKLSRQITPQASLPNLLEFNEEETRVDTLLLL